MSVELKACPFCGEVPVITDKTLTHHLPMDESFYLVHHKSNCYFFQIGKSYMFLDGDDTVQINGWNTRASGEEGK